MKNICFAVASLLAIFCSCSSSDDLREPANNSKNRLQVEVEGLQNEDGTRSAYEADGNKLYWQTGDVINVYDEILTTYDPYAFSSSEKAFVTDAAQSYIDGTISYAMYPGNLVDYAGWTAQGIRAVMSLATPIVVGADSEDVTTAAGKTLYKGNLPMWGTATGTFGMVHVSLKYLTAVMKLKLNNVAGHASFIKISSSMPLSGGFEAKVASSGKVMDPDAVLKKGTSALATKNYMIVDLRKVASTSTTVYVPIIPETYDDLEVSYTNKEVAAGKTLTTASINGTDGTEWMKMKEFPKSKQLKRNTVYVVDYAFK